MASAQSLLGLSQGEWAGMTSLDLAEVANTNAFLAHPGVWNTLEHIWTDKRTNLRIKTSARHVFYVNWLSHIIMNALFMYMLTTSLCNFVSPTEYILLFWISMFSPEFKILGSHNLNGLITILECVM